METKSKIILFVILMPIMALLATFLILAIPYGIASRLGMEPDQIDYWGYIFQSGAFWPTFGICLLISPIITGIFWFIVREY